MSIKMFSNVEKLNADDVRVHQLSSDTDGIIAAYYDLSGNPSVFMSGASATLGNVGIKTETPNEALTINGNVSSNGYYYGLGVKGAGGGDLELKAGEFPWTIKWSTGNIEAATSKGIVGGSYGGNQVMFPNGGGLQLNSLRDGGTYIQTGSAGDVQKTWEFTNDGALTLPTSGIIVGITDLSATNIYTPHLIANSTNLTFNGAISASGNISNPTFTANGNGATIIGDISATGSIFSSGTVIGALPVANKTTTFTFALSDARTVICVNGAADVVCSIPATSAVALPIGSQVTIINLGTNTVTLNGVAGGIDLSSAGNKFKLTAQHSVAFLFKVNTNEWIAYGDLKQ